QASVKYSDLEGAGAAIPESWLTLPVLNKENFLAVAISQDVFRRVIEADAAKLQDRASKAARKGDWDEVDRLLIKVRKMAEHSPWLGEIVTLLESLASDRNQAMFSKE